MSKIAKLRDFLKSPPKGWDSLPRKDKIAAASKVSGMTPGSVGVAASIKPDLRKAFGLPATPARRAQRSSRGGRAAQRKPSSQPGTVLAAKNAIDLMGFDDLVDVSRYLRRALDKRVESAKREIRSYR